MLYPILQPNITSSNQSLAIEALMSLYDKYTALGLYLLPKQKGQKFPLAKYWKDHQPVTRAGVLSDQLAEGLTGWCIVTGQLSGRLIALDFDTQAIKESGKNPQDLLDEIQKLSASQFIFKTPSGGIHVLYRQPEHQTLLTNSKTPIQGLDKRGEGGQIASVGAFYRYTDKAAQNKGVLDGHGGFYSELQEADYSHIPEMSDELYNWLLSVDKKAVSESFSKSIVGQQRLKKHFEQPSSEQERIVISALGSILKGWQLKTYEEWLRMWMSAHDASGGSLSVRDYILAHDDIIWRSFDSNGDGGQEHFKEVWASHQYREDGYTAASLFWLARQAGWMSTTGYEINPRLADKINVRYIGEWLATLKEIPRRLLLMSQTGSGKTFSLKYLYETLGQPKTVIFVPSIKLALELTSTLINRHDLPAVCYYDQDSLGSIDTIDMIAAPILVTTLQTFAMKVRVPMSAYGLVYIEESDQLIASFARGGGGRYSTHVSDVEARKGFAVLRSAFMTSGVVWCVDATMSQVTYRTANEMSTKLPVKTVINDWVEPKAPVLMVETVGRGLQEILRGLSLSKRIVAVSDTAKQAEEVIDVMNALGVLDDKKALVITRNTETDPDVHRFMENVNEEAVKYDLVSYNSVMASGVSITDFKPDIIVQFCTYLTPRVNLQLLNRYRNQTKVYCHYRLGENLYTQSDTAILSMIHEQVEVEGRLIAMPIATRNDDATLRDVIGAIAVADAQAQDKSPRDFYMMLLKNDGREVDNADGTPVAGVIHDARSTVSELRKQQRELLKSTWILTPPINRDEPAPKGYTDVQIAQGEIHNEIALALRNNIPKDVDPKHIFEVVSAFKNYGVTLNAMINQEGAIRKAEEYLADAGKALMSVRNNLTMIKVFSLVRSFYGTLDNVLTSEIVKERTPNFMMLLGANSQHYDQVITRKAHQYDAIMGKDLDHTERALLFSKIILGRLGLKQKTDGDTRIVNLDNAYEFMKWRDPELKINLDITAKSVDDLRISRKGLTIIDSNATLALMTQEKINLEMALQLLKQGDGM